MKRATITLPDDLEQELQDYLAEYDAPPSLTNVVQAALRQYLDDRKWKSRGYIPAQHEFSSPVAESGSEKRNISIDHDEYLIE